MNTTTTTTLTAALAALAAKEIETAPWWGEISKLAKAILECLRAEFGPVTFQKRSGSVLAVPEWMEPFVRGRTCDDGYETPRDGWSYHSAVNVTARRISPDFSFYELPNGQLVSWWTCPGDARSVGQAGFSNVRWAPNLGNAATPQHTLSELATAVCEAGDELEKKLTWVSPAAGLPPDLEEKLQALLEETSPMGMDEGWQPLLIAVKRLIDGIKAPFSPVTFSGESGSPLDPVEGTEKFLLSVWRGKPYSTPRDGDSYESSLTYLCREVGENVFELPDGTRMYYSASHGDPYSVGSYGVCRQEGGCADRAAGLLAAAEKFRGWAQEGKVICNGGLPEELRVVPRNVAPFGVFVAEGPIPVIDKVMGRLDGESLEAEVLQTPNGRLWRRFTLYEYPQGYYPKLRAYSSEELAAVRRERKKAARRKVANGGWNTIREFVECKRVYPARFLNLEGGVILSEGEEGTAVIGSFTGNGYGALRAVMNGRELASAKFPAGAVGAAKLRVALVERCLTGISLRQRIAAVWFPEEKTAAPVVLGHWCGRPEGALKALHRAWLNAGGSGDDRMRSAIASWRQAQEARQR